MLIIGLVIPFKLNVAIVEFVGNELEPTTRPQEHYVDCDNLNEVAHFVYRSLDKYGEGGKHVADDEEDLHYQLKTE